MPDERDNRTTHRPEATRIVPRAPAVEPPAEPKADPDPDPQATLITHKRDGSDITPDVVEASPPPGHTDTLGARTTIKRDLAAGGIDPMASGFGSKTTMKREEPAAPAHSEARSTRVILGATAQPAAQLAVGDVIKHRFEIVQELGRGGMGVVYKARDLRKVEAQDPDPYLAIKVLIGDMAEFDLGFVALQREGKHAQALNHPNLVKVFDFDRDGNLVFLTMELLKGESLQARLRAEREQPLSPEARLTIARGVIAGLAYAHARKIVHADIKPSNVFLCEDGEAKILDFGIARAAERDAVFDADDIGALTVDYASLEMLGGQRPQPSDDVYALGCLLFRLYAGQHPYQRQPADIAQREKMKPAFPTNLTRMQTRALARAIAFTREERYANATALGEAFDAYDWMRFSRNAAVAVLVLGTGLWFSQDWLLGRWSAMQLEPAEQAQVATALAEAHGNLDKAYWEDAAVRFVDVLRLDPYNADARAGLQKVVDGVKASMPASDLNDAMAILRERARCNADKASCPAWAREVLGR